MNVSDRAAPAGMRPLVAQFAKFLVVGGISFSLDYGLFVFLYNVFGVYYILSSTISFATSVVLNYVLSRKYVFEIREDRSVAREFAFYAVLNVIALFLNQVILYASVDYLSFSPPVGKIIATAVVLVYNFVSRKLLLERPPSTGRDAAQPPDGQRSETGVNPMSTERPLRFDKRLLVRVKEAWDAAVSKACESRLAAWWTGTSRPGRVDWALLGALLAVSFVTFLYGDVRATFEHSFNFMDALFSGRVADFYTIAIEHTSSGHPAVYDIPLYFLFGVWNLPTYLLYKFAGYDYLNATPAQLWLKTMMLVFVLLAARILMRIARTMGMDADRAKWVAKNGPIDYSIAGLVGANPIGMKALEIGMTKIGAPYGWGAAGPDVFDCSGLVLWSYAQQGITVPRTSQAQMAGGTPVSREELQPGDVVGFYPGATHVGIYAGNGQNVGAWNPSMGTRVGPNSWVGGTPTVIRVFH